MLLVKRPIIHLIFLIIALLLAFYLRVDDVGNWPVRWDEAYSVWTANMDIRVSTERTAGDVHPPFHYWFFYVWVRLAGVTEFAIRVQSVLFSQIAIAIVYSFTLRLSKQKIAASLALLLITLSPFHIEWSQDARMYALVTMFAALALYAYWRDWPRLLIFAGIGVALTHYLGAFVICFIMLHRVIHWRDCIRGRRQFLVAIAVIGAVCLLWFVYAIGLIRQDPGLATFEPSYSYKLMATLFTVNKEVHIGLYYPKVFLNSSLYCLGLFLAWRDDRRATALIVIGCLLPPFVISALALPFFPFHVNFLSSRYFVVFAPFVFAGYGIGLSAILRRRMLKTLGMVVCVGLVFHYADLTSQKRDARYFKDEYRSMMAALAALNASREKVFFISGKPKPIAYYNLDRVGYDVPKDGGGNPLNVTGVPDHSPDVPAMMESVFAGFPRFWLIEIEPYKDYPLNARIDWIDVHYHRVYHIPVGENNGISLYSKDEYEPLPDSSAIIPPVVTEARPGDQVRIGVPAGMRVDLVHSGQTVDTHLADTWMLHQFDIYGYYFNGLYELRVADESFAFTITHSQDFPGFSSENN